MRRRSVIRPLVFLLLAGTVVGGAASDLRAQGLRDVRIGERVRVTRRDSSIVIGEVLQNRRDTLTLQRGQWDVVTPLPYSQVSLFERAVSTDYQAGARRGARTGGMIGLAVIGVALYFDLRPKEGLRLPVRAALAVPLALGLAFAGRALGDGAVTDEWGVPQRVTVFVQPTEARTTALGMGVAIRW